MKNYKVKIENNVLMARIDGHHSIWMHRAPRSAPPEQKPGLYILIDDRGYCCYVGETDNFKKRMGDHERTDKFCWWSHSIFFWDDSSSGAFNSTDERRWYEKQLKEIAERNHPTFTKSVQNKPKPLSGDDVLAEMLALLDVIGFDVKNPSVPSLPVPPPSPVPTVSPTTPAHFPYAVGKVVQAVFPILQSDPRMTHKAIANLCKPESSAKFKTGGCPVLKPRTGKIDETKDSSGYHRYYPKLPLRFFGKDYWLTSQFNPPGITPVISWLTDLGFTRVEIQDICDKRWGKGKIEQSELPL